MPRCSWCWRTTRTTSPRCRKTIDATFANYETQTRSTAERSFIAGLISDMAQMVQFAQYVAYLALLLLLAAVANNVSMSVRDRLREMACLSCSGLTAKAWCG